MSTNSITVAEIAATSLAAVKVFEKYRIDYCCGGKRPLAEICREKGYDVEEVQAQLDAALSPPQAAKTREAVMLELPAIGVRLAKVFRVYNQRYGSTLIGLPETFADLRLELETHSTEKSIPAVPPLLATIREITRNFEIPSYACVTYRALMNGLAELDRDLQIK